MKSVAKIPSGGGCSRHRTSLYPNSLVTGKFTGNIVAPWPAITATITRDSNDLQQNSLRRGTGNFSEQNREMELPNRETFRGQSGNQDPGAPGSDRRVFCVSGFRSRTPHILAEWRDGRARAFVSNIAATAQQGRASGAGGTIRLASRRGGQLPSHAGAARRWRP